MRIAVIVATGLLLSTVAAAQAPTAEAQNEQAVRRFYEAINRGDAKGAAAEFTADAKNFGRSVGSPRLSEPLTAEQFIWWVYVELTEAQRSEPPEQSK